MVATGPLECPTPRESMRNRQEIRFYALAIPRIFFQLPLSSEIAQFENFARLDPAELKPVVVERWSLSVVYL
jgi:hypothetical protein